MSAIDEQNAPQALPRAPYETPTILSSASFERYALACTGSNGDRQRPREDVCRVGVKSGRSGICISCTAGS